MALVPCAVTPIWHEAGACEFAWGAVLEADVEARKAAEAGEVR